MDKRLIFLIVGILVLASLVLVLKKCSSGDKITKPTITVTPREIKEGDSVVFKDETKGATRWKWNFGDGEVSSTQTGSHHYISDGTYSLMVEVWGSFGKLVDSSVKVIVAKRIVDVPVANFSIEGPLTATIGEKVTYSCNTPNVTRFRWRIDETGQTDTNKSISYSFSSPGVSRINLHVVMADNSQGDKFIEVAIKNKPLPPGAKAPPKKSSGEIEAGIMKTLLAITDPGYNGDMPAVYYTMIQQFFCGNQQINVEVNSGKGKDIDSYCSQLLLNKGTKILGVKAVVNAQNCVEHLSVTQK